MREGPGGARGTHVDPDDLDWAAARTEEVAERAAAARANLLGVLRAHSGMWGTGELGAGVRGPYERLTETHDRAAGGLPTVLSSTGAGLRGDAARRRGTERATAAAINRTGTATGDRRGPGARPTGATGRAGGADSPPHQGRRPPPPPEGRRTAPPRQVRRDETGLGRAVVERRRDVGRFGGGGHPAFRVRNADGTDDILVDHGGGKRSERVAGVPLLDTGRGTDVTEIHSARDYCNQRGPNCDAWTGHYFPNADRTRRYEYDNNIPGSHQEIRGLPPIKRRK
ncbi:hypothetical protein [Allostreptomyces psammosilenae]|uniref:Uncharacterized protein n=1 Tax=Allostreptomyces psammosilenae TaxID=1892865 RepID=A0A853AB59_9ACTN|nr:hypothetical protein [Allostreptomyces psammosilenae]NYI07602.1 hypothetical protein [Allostreptomyces psammosilenae]